MSYRLTPEPWTRLDRFLIAGVVVGLWSLIALGAMIGFYYLHFNP